MSASETLESLRRELAIEEQGATQHPSLQQGAAGGSSIPVMESLRSPTTRTILAIIQNQNHFEVIKDFVLEAQEEERQTQELIDAAEEVQAIPLASAFATQLGEVVADDKIHFHLPRNAAGDVLGIKAEDSAILKRWGKKPPITEEDEDNYDATSMPIDRLQGTSAIIGASPSSVGGRAAAAEESSNVREMRMPDHDFDGQPVSQASSDPDPTNTSTQHSEISSKQRLEQMLKSQKEDAERRAESYNAYSQQVATYMKWQQSRLDAFDHLLEPFPEPSAPGKLTTDNASTVPSERSMETEQEPSSGKVSEKPLAE